MCGPGSDSDIIWLSKPFGLDKAALEGFCSANMSFAVALLMSKQLARVGIQTN